jgi:hypothetical protein
LAEGASTWMRSESAPAWRKRMSRRPMRRKATAVAGRRHGSTAACVTLSVRWNQRQEREERRDGYQATHIHIISPYAECETKLRQWVVSQIHQTQRARGTQGKSCIAESAENGR